MSFGWPLAPIADAADPIDRFEEPLPGVTYRQIGVRLWGEGAYEREPLDGASTKYKSLNRVKRDDIIVNKIWARNGSVSVVSDGLDGCYCSGEFPLFRPDRERLEPKWFYWMTKTPWFWDRCDEQSQGTSGKNRIRPEKFLAIEIPLPPLEEQRRIVATIERLAAKLEEARGLRSLTIEEATMLRRSSYRSAETWSKECGQRLQIAGVITSHDSGWSPACDEVPAASGEWGVLKTTSVQWDGFDAEANKVLRTGLAPRPEITVKDGDVLVTRAGPMDRVGVACTVRNPPGMLMLSDKIIRMVTDEKILPEYLSTCIAMPSSQELLRQGKTGLAASQVNISRQKLLNLEIFVPSLAEQRRIVAYLDGLQAKVDRLKALQAQTRAELEALLPAILDRAFKGEL